MMSNITVFVFLLENIPGFEDVLKSTLHSMSGKYSDDSVFTKCNPDVADLIWSNIHVNRDLIKQLNYLPILRRSKVLNGGLSKSSEQLKNSLENNYIENDFIDHDKNNNKHYITNKVYKSTQSEFPNNAPFLVAIFETIKNITAQTCGGTLLSPHWVLTAASCLDLLPSFYNNLTKQKSNIHESFYTIISNGKNPLVDGTVHNVTKVMLHPKHNPNINKKLKWSEPQIALMKIEPAANIHAMPIYKSKIKLGIGVRVYGWTLQKNSTDDSTREYMGVTSISANIIDSYKCKANYNFVDKTSMICLSADNESNIKMNQMSSGGPVVVYSEGIVKILAVAQIDTSSRIIAYTLTNYYWINDIINK